MKGYEGWGQWQRLKARVLASVKGADAGGGDGSWTATSHEASYLVPSVTS